MLPPHCNRGPPIIEFRTEDEFKEHLGKENQYHSYLQYFQKEIEMLESKSIIYEYLFARNELADDLLIRFVTCKLIAA